LLRLASALLYYPGMGFPEPNYVKANGIRMAVYEQGEGRPVIFLHGFPELAYSWRHQLPAFAAAGYRAIAPDMRGFGRTEVPTRVSDYTAEILVADMAGLLDALRLESAVFVGHDWGALTLWHMAMLEPHRMQGLIALNIPHIRRPPADPVELMRQRFGDDFYIVNFQDSDEADRLFESDPRHFLNMMMRKHQLTREQFERLPAEHQVLSLVNTARRSIGSGEPLLSEEDLDYFEEAYRISGFSGAIHRYRNWSLNWERLAGVDETIRIPTLFIGARDDVVVSLQQIDAMRELVTDLELHVLDDCGHWSQQEHPDAVNRLMLDWLVKRG